jgi:riboflavin synthase
MFTGLVSAIGTIASIEARGSNLRRIAIRSPYAAESILLGASICCAGVCLTATSIAAEGEGSVFTVDAAAETLALTTAGGWQIGSRLNLERSLKIGDELGGHLVTGHVDGRAMIERIETVTEAAGDWGPSTRFDLSAPAELARFIAKKGSVCLDGTSLTVNMAEENRFNVLLIPHTLAVTTWGERRAGDSVNLEVDLMARYAARLMGSGIPLSGPGQGLGVRE